MVSIAPAAYKNAQYNRPSPKNGNNDATLLRKVQVELVHNNLRNRQWHRIMTILIVTRQKSSLREE